MKKFYLFLIVIATPVILLLMSNSSGSIGGRSGSIGDDGHTCTDCHSGTATSKFGWITTNIPAEGYTPGQTYTITATGTHIGVVKFGFELTVEDSQGNKVGTLQISDPARTHFTNSNHAVTHTAAGNVPSGNSNSWTMNWVAPSNINGNVGIYAAYNAANGNGNTSGDVIYKSNIFTSEIDLTPFLVSMVPDSALQGETVTTLITAENSLFTLSDPVISLAFSGNPLEILNALSFSVIDDTKVEAVFAVPVNASVGAWHLNVNDLILADAFTVNLLTGLTSNTLDEVLLYPNPAAGRFFVENQAGSEIAVYNSRGELMILEDRVSEKQVVDISRLSRGFYLVKIKSEGREIVEKLLVN